MVDCGGRTYIFSSALLQTLVIALVPRDSEGEGSEESREDEEETHFELLMNE